MGFGQTALKLIQTFFYAVAFCASAIILGFYSYFLAIQADRNRAIPKWQQAVEGMAGIGVVYTIFAVILTCCLGGKKFFAFLAILMDILLCGAFIAIAVLTRDGTKSCSGNVNTPLGSGPANSHGSFGSNGFGTGNGENVTYSVSLRTACIYNKACFAVAIIGAAIFLISAFTHVWLARNHSRENKFGPSPKNNYTTGSGSGSKWFKRSRGAKTTTGDRYAKDAEAQGALGVPPTTVRPSQETGYTGTTAGHADGYARDSYAGDKYNNATVPVAGGYHTAPAGTGVNPYYQGEAGRNPGANF